MRCYQVFLLSLPLAVAGNVLRPVPVASQPFAINPLPAISAPLPRPKQVIHEVLASWYGPGFAGRLTTSGERFNPHRFTAASVTVPLGSIVRVENPKNGRAVSVRINDCGPFVRGRSMDLSLRAAQRIGITRQGVARLKVTPIKIPPRADADRCIE
jgi:rare lipoprotein A (peptidoglycan hydrolase)